MEEVQNSGPQPKGKKEQHQVVNEQDQQEKVNPSGEGSDISTDSEKTDYSRIKREQGLEEGNSYEDDPKRGENKMPRN